MTKIKICGLKDEAGLSAAIDAGADFFGMVMAEESPRHIDIDVANHLLAVAGKKIKSVLLLVNPALDEATYLARELNPYALQLHGDEPADLCAAIKNQTGKKIIKAMPIATADDFARLEDYTPAVDYFLFDAKPNKNLLDNNTAGDKKTPADANHDSRHGGLGRVFDWSLLAHYNASLPFFLAGGLTPDNVGLAVAQVQQFAPQFFAVDVSTGVEESLGKKSPAKIKKFCLAVNRASNLAGNAVGKAAGKANQA
ncbi:MAG: phosphoribosylanthranilate isomerase [Hydrotalea sp.]|nr:phosphoribosylanthranilate isomerase [Hydrotalea sp.]